MSHCSVCQMQSCHCLFADVRTSSVAEAGGTTGLGWGGVSQIMCPYGASLSLSGSKPLSGRLKWAVGPPWGTWVWTCLALSPDLSLTFLPTFHIWAPTPRPWEASLEYLGQHFLPPVTLFLFLHPFSLCHVILLIHLFILNIFCASCTGPLEYRFCVW